MVSATASAAVSMAVTEIGLLSSGFACARHVGVRQARANGRRLTATEFIR
jgi:hypothetical protein